MIKYHDEKHFPGDEIQSPLSSLAQEAVYRCHILT
jgi:hypothetical protein